MPPVLPCDKMATPEKVVLMSVPATVFSVTPLALTLLPVKNNATALVPLLVTLPTVPCTPPLVALTVMAPLTGAALLSMLTWPPLLFMFIA